MSERSELAQRPLGECKSGDVRGAQCRVWHASGGSERDPHSAAHARGRPRRCGRSPPYELQLSARFVCGRPGAGRRLSGGAPPPRAPGPSSRHGRAGQRSAGTARHVPHTGPAARTSSFAGSSSMARWEGAERPVVARVAGPGPQAVPALEHARRLGLFCQGSLNPSRGLCASLAQRARRGPRRGGGARAPGSGNRGPDVTTTSSMPKRGPVCDEREGRTLARRLQ